ncbi:unnamed protein product [Caenorhabditis bovis]|uniref:Uncharacterized protein n=1 Tax=Caenorhabditis bovis TaxID=2654633 RepID=A0A8S1F206_9PELO|nr:unnamed protein product [Caenorhabditis bovis]
MRTGLTSWKKRLLVFDEDDLGQPRLIIYKYFLHDVSINKGKSSSLRLLEDKPDHNVYTGVGKGYTPPIRDASSTPKKIGKIKKEGQARSKSTEIVCSVSVINCAGSKKASSPPKQSPKGTTPPTPAPDPNRSKEGEAAQKKEEKPSKKVDVAPSPSGEAKANEKEEKKESRADEDKGAKHEDSFDKMQPKQIETKRKEEIGGKKVENKGDYKTWNKVIENSEFNKTLSEKDDKKKKKDKDSKDTKESKDTKDSKENDKE